MKETRKYGTEKLGIAIFIMTMLYGLEFWSKFSNEEDVTLVVIFYTLTIISYLLIFYNRLIVSKKEVIFKYFNPLKCNKIFPIETIGHIELSLDGGNLTLGKVTIYTKENAFFKISFLSSIPKMENLEQLLQDYNIEVRKIGLFW